MIYLLCFSGSAALTAVAERQKTKRGILLFSLLALLLPCLLAGLRSVDVGRDVSHYVKPMVDAAVTAGDLGSYLQSSWLSSIGTLYLSDFEYGFTLLVYAVARLTGSLQVTLFVIAAAILVPVYIALFRNRGKMPVWLGLLAFYLLFYNGTLNLMRQWMAMALLILAFQMFCEKRYVLTAIFSAASLLFHYSAALIVLIFGVYFVLWFFRDVQYTPRIKGKTYVLSGQVLTGVLLALMALLAVLHIDKVFQLLDNFGLHRFKGYLNGEKPYFLDRELWLRLPLLVLYVWHWKRFSAHSPMAPFYLTMLLLDGALAQLGSVNPYAYRIPLFFSMFTVFSLPVLYASLETKAQRWITATLSVFYLVSYWGYLHTEQLLHLTYPYRWFFCN